MTLYGTMETGLIHHNTFLNSSHCLTPRYVPTVAFRKRYTKVSRMTQTFTQCMPRYKRLCQSFTGWRKCSSSGGVTPLRPGLTSCTCPKRFHTKKTGHTHIRRTTRTSKQVAPGENTNGWMISGRNTFGGRRFAWKNGGTRPMGGADRKSGSLPVLLSLRPVERSGVPPLNTRSVLAKGGSDLASATEPAIPISGR